MDIMKIEVPSRIQQLLDQREPANTLIAFSLVGKGVENAKIAKILAILHPNILYDAALDDALLPDDEELLIALSHLHTLMLVLPNNLVAIGFTLDKILPVIDFWREELEYPVVVHEAVDLDDILAVISMASPSSTYRTSPVVTIMLSDGRRISAEYEQQGDDSKNQSLQSVEDRHDRVEDPDILIRHVNDLLNLSKPFFVVTGSHDQVCSLKWSIL